VAVVLDVDVDVVATTLVPLVVGKLRGRVERMLPPEMLEETPMEVSALTRVKRDAAAATRVNFIAMGLGRWRSEE